MDEFEIVTGQKKLPNNALFAYSIEKNENSLFHRHIYGKNYVINTSEKTEVLQSSFGNKMVSIIGFCIDAYGKLERDQIAKWLVSINPFSPETLFPSCDRLAGKYVILVENGESAYVWGDATCSLQLNYSLIDDEGEQCIASSDMFVALKYGYKVSKLSTKIREKSSLLQPLPFNLTMFDEVKALLPNHYLCLGSNRYSIRIKLNKENTEKENKVEDLINRTATLVENIAKQYGEYYALSCPVTSGYDSRVVYAIQDYLGLDKIRYTFFHRGFTNDTGDIEIPRRFISDSGKEYSIIKDMIAPEDFKSQVRNFLGGWQDVSTIDLAYTYIRNVGDKALVNGNIIGQTGQSYVTNVVPNKLITPRFMQCKIHNYSDSALLLLGKYSEEIRSTGECNKVADLFEWESRLGRWAPQADLVYSFCGIASLNFFNCREIILSFIKVPRRDRVHKKIHKKYLNLFNPELLKYPFNPDERFGWIKNSWIMFLGATYLKFLKDK